MSHPKTHRAHRRLAPLAPLLLAPLLFAPAAPARAAIEESYQPGEAPIGSTWYALASPAAQAADRGYLAGMRPHHAGALTMSRDYLADPARRSPLLQALAAGIITNQRFEIGVLDAVAHDLDQPALRLPFGLRLQAVATEGTGATARFFRVPMPSATATPLGPVSERDVQFAKAMITHHQGALAMAHAYHADPAVRNGFLGLMNVDIITDQGQEIALMQAVIAAFRGDAAAVVVDPAMVHGMDGMAHGAADGAVQPALSHADDRHADHSHADHPGALPARPAGTAQGKARGIPPAHPPGAPATPEPARGPDHLTPDHAHSH